MQDPPPSRVQGKAMGASFFPPFPLYTRNGSRRWLHRDNVTIRCSSLLSDRLLLSGGLLLGSSSLDHRLDWLSGVITDKEEVAGVLLFSVHQTVELVDTRSAVNEI